MPKRTYKIQGFHGGMNTNADSRDVTDIESPSLQDVKISNIGTIKTLGSVADTSTSNTLQILPSRGLFSMDADRKVSDNGLRDETLIIVYDDGGNSFDVKDNQYLELYPPCYMPSNMGGDYCTYVFLEDLEDLEDSQAGTNTVSEPIKNNQLELFSKS